MDKLDTIAVSTAGAARAAGAVGGVRVNGPEGVDLNWDAIDWRRVEDDVRRLRQRIFTASRAGDLKKVRNLQKLMLRSRSNALVSVRRVTELNAGRKTAGVDGKVVLASWEKAELVARVQCQSPWKAQPVKRVYIPKGNRRQRPLGIPVIVDRCRQAVAVSALEPEWEARFESKSYGFRPGRGCHDAIAAIFKTVCGPSPTRQWVLDADLTAAFDRIDHHHVINQLGTFPARDWVAGWLKAGVIEKGYLTPTMEGVPQGGVISPLLMNVALHGMETAAGVRYQTTAASAGRVMRNSPVMVRYADDLVVMCASREQAEQVKARLVTWLAPRGLSFNEDKTRIVSLENEGFDFLGFSVRRHDGKLLIKPSKAAMRRIRERLTVEMRSLRGANSAAVIHRLNPIIRGWAAYYRTVVSNKAFRALDNHMWRLTYKWARFSHPNKSKHWVVARYFGMFNKSRQDKWVFGDRDSGFYLYKFAWTQIVRHQLVTGGSSPDDPTLIDYWARRRRRVKPPLGQATLRLLQAQRGRCPLCGDLLLHADREPQNPHEWEQWFRVTRKAIRKHAIAVDPGCGTPDEHVALRLVHASCLRRTVAEQAQVQHFCPPTRI
jgi:RNA-directed DNA polymerase